MKLENFKQCAEIVDKINDIQKQIDYITESASIDFCNRIGNSLFEITLKEPNQSKPIFVESHKFIKQIVILLTTEIIELKNKLDKL